MTTPPKKLAPEGFDHAAKRAAYEAKRREHTALYYVSRDGQMPIMPREPIDVPEGKVPNGGFNGL